MQYRLRAIGDGGGEEVTVVNVTAIHVMPDVGVAWLAVVGDECTVTFSAPFEYQKMDDDRLYINAAEVQ